MRTALAFLKPFLVSVICFFLVIFGSKIIEFVSYLLNNKAIVAWVFAEMMYTNVIACGFLSFCVFPIYALFASWSKKIALWISASLFGLLILGELALGQYTAHTGLLLGGELVARPFWEILQTSKSAFNPYMILSVGIISLLIFDLFVCFLNHKKIKNNILIIFTTLIIAATPLFFTINPYWENTVINRTWYCIDSCINYLSHSYTTAIFKGGSSDVVIPYNDTLMQQYHAMFPERIVPDSLYPLEYIDETPNVLGAFFPTKNEKPNIVIVIVESMGTDWFGGTKEQTCYTPYLDSLSKQSLLWTNCLSATQRSFGAVPAITGSVPFGIKGFQFGAMPQHNSLISILKTNDYQTNAFYASDFSFDNILDYLLAQHIDHLSSFHHQITKDDDHTYWGYNDGLMFAKSLDYLNKVKTTKPLLNLFITSSTHDNINIRDKERQQYFIDKVKTLISTYPKALQERETPHLQKYAAMLYADDAIKQFVESYSKRDDYQNTIFVFTGDHAYGINSKNILSPNHVPLIIWSPMLLRSQAFPALVSHNDIAPSITALLKHNFKLSTPNTVHWIGSALDTSHYFRSKQRACLLQYARETKEFIFDEYLRTGQSKAELFKITPSLELQKIKDKELLSNIESKMKATIYVDNYAYFNKHLTKHPIWKEEQFVSIFSQQIDSLVCRVPDTKPSEGKISNIVVKPFSITNNQDWEKLKVSIIADACYEKLVYQDSFILLKISCKSSNGLYNSAFKDNISKFFTDKQVKPNTWTKIHAVKEFLIKDAIDLQVSMQLHSTEKDYLWIPGHQVTLKNIQIEIASY